MLLLFWVSVICTWTRLLAGQPRNCRSILDLGKYFSLLHCLKTASGSYHPPLQCRTRDLPRQYSGRGVKVTPDLHLLPPVTGMPSWHAEGQFYILLLLLRYTGLHFSFVPFLTETLHCKDNKFGRMLLPPSWGKRKHLISWAHYMKTCLYSSTPTHTYAAVLYCWGT
jgi:hypothetical protein